MAMILPHQNASQTSSRCAMKSDLASGGDLWCRYYFSPREIFFKSVIRKTERIAVIATRRLNCRHNNLTNGKTKTEFLANLEHEFRVYGHTVWLGPADGQHEFDL